MSNLKRITISDVTERWLKAKLSNVKPSTYYAYAYITRRHIIPCLGDCAYLTEERVARYILEKKSQNLSTKSIKDILVVLDMIYKYGVRNRMLQASEWKVAFGTSACESGIKIFEEKNYKALIAYVRENIDYANLGLYICLCTGLRIGEVCGIKWKDIDIDNGTIEICRTVSRIYKGEKLTEVIVCAPKTSFSHRLIPLVSELITILRPMVRDNKADNYLLTNSPTPREPRSFRNHYYRLCRKLNIPSLKFHCLRHSFATHCINNSNDFKTLSVILGHANVSTTLKFYMHPDMTQKQRCINSFISKLN